MSKKSKGRSLEKIVEGWLKRAGWTTHLVQPKMTFIPQIEKYVSRPQDIFGADILACKASNRLLLVQVTCDSHLQRKLDEFAKYPIPHEFALKLIVQAKKKNSRWNFNLFEVIGNAYVPVSRELIETILGEPLFWELENKLMYLEKI